MNYGRPDWTSSLVGAVPALRGILDLNQEVDDLDRSLLKFLANDLLEEVSQQRSIARFQPHHLQEVESESDLRRTVTSALADAGNIASTQEEITASINELQQILRTVAEGKPSVPDRLRWVLTVLDRTCDLVFGPPPIASSF